MRMIRVVTIASKGGGGIHGIARTRRCHTMRINMKGIRVRMWSCWLTILLALAIQEGSLIPLLIWMLRYSMIITTHMWGHVAIGIIDGRAIWRLWWII